MYKRVIELASQVDGLLEPLPPWVRLLGYAAFKGVVVLIIWRLKIGNII